MAKSRFSGKLDFKLVDSMEEPAGRPERDTPFQVLILGDFSGRANRGLNSGSLNRSPILVDRDNFDEVLARLGVEIHLPMGKKAPPLKLRFRELDDFHPDQLFDRLEPLKALRESRRKLADPRTFAAAAEELGLRPKGKVASEKQEERPHSPRTPTPDLSGVPPGSLLDQILEGKEGQPVTGPARDTSELGAFVQDVVQPHIMPQDDSRRAEILASLDEAASGLVGALLHNPDFQALEAAWRGLRFLVSRAETDEHLKLYLLDVSQAELAADLTSAEDLRSTGLYRFLVEETVETPGGEPWAVLIGNFSFGPTRGDAELLGRLGKIAGAAGAPFISAARDAFLGCDSLAKTPDPRQWKGRADVEGSRAWDALRKLPQACYLGLVLPRFLLRLPYGADTDPTERFEFEEMAGGTNHDHYLWGNPALACAYLLTEGFSREGWNFRPGIIQELGNLPLHIYQEDGEKVIKPCGEVLLTERAAEAILEKGLMPLLSFRNQDVIRLARFQSLADPPTGLGGRWME